MRKIYSILIVLTALSASAQDYFTFHGKVLGQSDSLPIYNCNIYIDGEGIGTTTNDDGFFRLTFPSEYLDKNLVVSFIGYESYHIRANEAANSNFIVYLDQQIAMLNEVTITSIDPKDVVERAIKEIPNNYPQTKSTYDIFYKEIGKVNNNYYRFQEIAASLYSEGFNQKNVGRKDYPLWIHGKRSSHNYHSNSDGGNGLFVIYWLNWAKGFLTKKALKNYFFEFEGRYRYENIETYKIKVTRPDWDSETVIYIDVDDYAIVYMESNYQNFDQTKPKVDDTWFSKEYNLEVSFREIDDLWYINRIYDYRHNGLRNDSSIQITRSLYINNVRTEKLDHKHKITPETDLFNYPIPFDPKFWKDYNAPLESEKEKKIKADLEKHGISLQKQFSSESKGLTNEN